MRTMQDETYDDERIRDILNGVRVIAMVGVSANEVRPSYIVFKYLLGRGFRMIGVNPGLAGRPLLGQMVVARLSDINEPIDMVDIFRAPEAVPAIVAEALALPRPPRVIWMQLGIRHEAAAAEARAVGLTVIMNRCPKIEYGRLSREIGWAGVNSGIVSAKRPQRMGGFQRLTIGRPQDP
jgi:uncharacterized protein